MTTRVALVTGASSGFGQLTARLLAQQGFRVFGTSRRPLGWGIGLAAHAITVFGVGGWFGSDWEEREVRKILDKEAA